MKKPKSLLLVFPVLVIVALVLYRTGHLFPCLFYQKTGFFCVGCGGSRAVYALLHGNFAAALHYNALILLFLPPLGYFLTERFLATLFGREVLPPLRLSSKAWIALALAAAIFTVARNLPFSPFLFLRP